MTTDSGLDILRSTVREKQKQKRKGNKDNAAPRGGHAGNSAHGVKNKGKPEDDGSTRGTAGRAAEGRGGTPKGPETGPPPTNEKDAPR